MNTSKIGFFYQSARNPCAVEMNFRQIKKNYPESPISFWEDTGDLYIEICERYGINRKKVFRNSTGGWVPSKPATDVVGALDYLNRIYISLVTDLDSVEWFIHMEDDVWLNKPLYNKLESWGDWFGGIGKFAPNEALKFLNLEHPMIGGACGGTIIKRSSFIQSYHKIQDIDWNILNEKWDRQICFTDVAISALLMNHGITWNEWDGWAQYYPDENSSKFNNAHIIHNVKYWYSKGIDELNEINTSSEVKEFLKLYNGGI